ncbi:LysE family translocator [Shewanella submarina]|uniref:LysE family translocator n=1 Tax=Shewanella submarina TaxID=2016376 RepID=A0ABV7G573_9GAMM|nr:LysE family translocator [Shewanella submarina]MCL1038354.1 LysE family translocator [Shewanella submarina]
MDISALSSIVVISLLGAMTPGQSVIMVGRNTIANGKSHGIVTACSHAVGVGIYALLCLVGLAATLKASPLLFNGIMYTGAGFLAWLGFQALTSKKGLAERISAGEKATYKESAAQGFAMAILNPKVIIFFLALFSQFINDSYTATEIAIVALIPAVLDAAWYSFVATIVSRPKILEKLRNNAGIVDKVSGVILIALAIKVVTG